MQGTFKTHNFSPFATYKIYAVRKKMIKYETITIPSASMGEINPLADIGNIEYIHAGYETTDNISEDEKARIGKGMIHTILPYTIEDNFNRIIADREFSAAVVENEYLRAIFIPELGGRLWSLYDKENERELFYVNPVFQPANLAIRTAWFSGGVEFNVGIKGHNPLTCDPYFARIARTKKAEEVLQIYEYERIRGLVFGIEVYLPEGSRVLYIKDFVENVSGKETWSYWWSNIAVPETPSTRVLVPTTRSYLSTYDEGHYVLDKVDIPYIKDIDVSRPTNLKRSLDFFYEIEENSTERWVAAIGGDGYGLAQFSTREMLGRKMFLWGQSPGGRNWTRFLSDGSESTGYIEIQAGRAYTQLEHIPMKKGEKWSFTEGYTGISCDPALSHSDNWEIATSEAADKIRINLGVNKDADLDTSLRDIVPTEFVSFELLSLGSGAGALEELERGEKLSDKFDFYSESMTSIYGDFVSLANQGFLPNRGICEFPELYISGEGWYKRLKDSLSLKDGLHWYTYYQLGVVSYQLKRLDEAREYFMRSNELCENAWSTRNLALLDLYAKDTHSAARLMTKALSLCPECVNLYSDAMKCYLAAGQYRTAVSCFNNAPDKVKARGRMQLTVSVAYIKLGRYTDAANYINENFQMDDMREGEISLSHVWEELYTAILREEYPKMSDSELISLQKNKYPLPSHLDFRMHDEDEEGL